MTSGQYEFVRERYSYIVIRTSPKGNGHYFHQVSGKAHWARQIKACRTP